MKKITFLFFLIVLITNCKKYPDDVKVPHFGGPERRLINGSWVSVKIINIKNGGFNYHSDDAGIIFNKDHKCISKAPFLPSGSWSLVNKKKDLLITDNQNHTVEYVILQLDRDKLKFKNDSLEYTFTPIRIH